jgi:hypothetical protein
MVILDLIKRVLIITILNHDVIIKTKSVKIHIYNYNPLFLYIIAPRLANLSSMPS